MATAAPVNVTNPPNPQVPVGTKTVTASRVNLELFGQKDLTGYIAFDETRLKNTQALIQQRTADFKKKTGRDPTTQEEDSIATFAGSDGEDAAIQQFASQIVAAGAGTFTETTTPLFSQQTAPTPVASAANPQIPPAATPAAATPATAPPAVAPAANPQVPTLPGFTATTIPTVNEGKFKAADPSGYAQFQAYEKQQQAEQVARLTALAKQNTGKNFLTASERSIVNADAATLAKREAIKQFTPQILAADAGKQVTTQGPTGQVPTRAPGAVGNSPYPRTAGFVDSAAGAAQGIRREPAAPQAAGTNNARQQAPIQAQTSQLNTADWRVRLKLAPQSQYLYNASQPGILQPLKVTNGIIFPYTPQISTQYQANYSPYNLTHSNFKGYFYQGSNTGEVKITATFTAQDTSEANYLLAVIHFFRSATKMFYGATDAFRGAPPPLVFLSGLGEYQFNNHPCVIQSFDYTLPADVDYIRANSSNNTGTTLTQNRDRQNLPISSNNPSGNRLQTAGLTPGGIPVLPAPTPIGTTAPTSVPTKMDISITLLPMQTRIQVSQQFSMEKFANGNLLKGGFW